MKGDQLCKQHKHARYFWIADPGRFWINSTQRSEKFTCVQYNRNRNVALKPILFRCMVITEVFVFLHMVNDYRLTAVAYFITDGRFYFKLTSWYKTEINFITNATCYPSVFSYPGYCGKSHSSR